MTNNNNGPTFLIENGRLYTENETDGLRQVTHVRRLDAGGEEYLELWVSAAGTSMLDASLATRCSH